MLSYQVVRPWLIIPLFRRWNSVCKGIEDKIRIMHDISFAIIRQRKQDFERVGSSSSSGKKRLALLDVLLKTQNEQGDNIDDEGIREEVDTFMFEVR